MFERQTLEVRDYYKKAGLEIPRLHKEPDDHIGYELLFASFLCGQESTSAQDTLILFLKDHLLQWAHLFARRVWEHSTSDYFKGNALLAIGSLESLGQALDIAVQWQDDGYNLV
jgi:TorA maturation chaperone TorD